MNRIGKSRNNRAMIVAIIGLITLFIFGVVTSFASAPTIGETFDYSFDGRSAVLQVRIPEFNVDADGRVSAEGLHDVLEIPGAPVLPYYTRLIPLPEGHHAQVSIEKGTTEVVSVAHVIPGSDYQIDDPSILIDSSLADLPLVTQTDPLIYNTDALYPDESTLIVDSVLYQGSNFARITLYPLRYNPVRQEIVHVLDWHVDIQFVEGPGTSSATGRQTTAEIKGCCGVPLDPSTAATELPVGQNAVKIEVNTAGLYELTYADLIAVAPEFDGAAANNIRMLTAGQDVAFQFVGNSSDGLTSGDAIRFYGYPFDAHRVEEQYVINNVFWIWVGEAGTQASEISNAVTGHPVVTQFYTTITEEPDNGYYATYTDRWPFYDNEPDAWYWDKLSKSSSASSINHDFTMTLPDPAASADEATYEVEITGNGNESHVVRATINGYDGNAYRSWYSKTNVNATGTVTNNLLIDGANVVSIIDSSPSWSTLYLNRISVSYWRQMQADADQLIFNIADVGPHEATVAGFSNSAPIVWNITDPLNPTIIALAGGDVVDNGGTYSYRIAQNHTSNAEFIALADSALLAPAAMSLYNVTNLDPIGGADWVAVTYPDFMTQTQRLGTHRASADHGNLATQVVNVNDIFNQYGYGLPTPHAIRNYMAYAVDTWTTAPRYLTLVGDGSVNPREIDCSFCRSYWTTDKSYVPAFLLMADRFLGQIPTDHPYSLLTGSDELPDIAVGRISAETEDHVRFIVDKIIQYDVNQLNPEAWMQNMLFVSDNTDSAGNFCEVSHGVGDNLDTSINVNYLCLTDSPSDSDVEDLRDGIFDALNTTGVGIFNYRGHGSIVDWGAGIMHKDDEDLWDNSGAPVVIVTADCLDGHYGWGGRTSISESFMRIEDSGTAAHWSSAGLGYLYEYNVMHAAFYNGLMDHGMTAIGDAIAYAKIDYTTLGYNSSMAYAMSLQGDPAMQLMRPEYSIAMNSSHDSATIGQTVELVLDITNNGVYPGQLDVGTEIPPQFSYAGINSGSGATASLDGSTLNITLDDGIGLGETMQITVSLTVVSAAGDPVTVRAEVFGNGWEINSGDEVALASISLPSEQTAVQLSGQDAIAPTQYTLLLMAIVILLTFGTACIASSRFTQR